MDQVPNSFRAWDRAAFCRTLERELPGVSWADRAARAGLSRETLRRIARDDARSPSAETIGRTAAALRVDPIAEGWMRCGLD